MPKEYASYCSQAYWSVVSLFTTKGKNWRAKTARYLGVVRGCFDKQSYFRFLTRTRPTPPLSVEKLCGRTMEKLLGNNVERLLSVLTEVHQPFLWDLYKCGCLSEEERRDFLNMDNSVDPEIKARYLWGMISERIVKNRVADTFITKLSQHEFGSKLGLFLKFEMPKDNRNITFSKDQISLLTDALVDCSYKWEEIGICLRLPKHVIEECRSSSNNNIRLHEILIKWQERNPNATIKEIIEVLKKDVVGMQTLADHLLERLKETTMSQISELRLNSTMSQLAMQRNVEVLDGKSTLLYVPHGHDSVKYQWMKGRKTLHICKHYSSVCGNILLIKRACQGLEGQYRCHIKDKDSIEQKVIKLVIIYKPEKQHLIEKYIRDDEVPKDSWPPVGISTFIDLALIKEGELEEFKYSVRGDMDDILKSKELCGYNELFGSYEDGALVLLEGRPGSGKTTLTHKIVREWAIGPDVLYGAKFVFLISLRILNATKKDQTLSEILAIFYQKKDIDLIVEELEESYGEGACFIIDGLDEYHTDKSIIRKLINKECLPKAMIIVASRPIGTVDLRYSSKARKRIEVLGFSRQQISTYIKEYSFLAGRGASDLESYLESHVNILYMCYLPVHVAMICYIYNYYKEIPNTETKIYEDFTLLTIKRVLVREGKKEIEQSLKHLNPETKVLFDNICKLAFVMTCNSEKSIHQSKTSIRPLSNEKGCDAYSLGLVTVDSTASLLNFEEVYSFLHLTFQEYLAAYYIANQDCSIQLNIIRENVDKKEMVIVWKFYCGIVKFSDSHSEHMQLILNSQLMTNAYKIQCAFESQQPIVCCSALTSEMLAFEDYLLSPADFHAISYVTSHVPYPVSLVLKDCVFNERGLKFVSFGNIKYLAFSTKKRSQLRMLNMLLKQWQSLETIDLLHQAFKDNDFQIVTEGVNFPRLKVLRIHNMPLADLSNQTLINFNSSKLEQVQYLYYLDSRRSHKAFLSNLLETFECEIVPLCEFPSNILSNLEFDVLKVTRFLLELSTIELINSNIDDHGVQCLLSSSNYESVRLDVNKITDKGAVFISELIRQCRKLKYLSLSCNMIGDQGAIAIIQEISDTSNLKELSLQGNNISKDGESKIADMLNNISQVRCKLSILQEEQFAYIWDIFTMESSYQSITRAFQSFKYLHTLNLNGHVSSAVLDKIQLSAIGGGLKYCNSLKVLILRSNGIGDGIAVIAKGLKHCCSLEVLDLHNNAIDNDGAAVLGDMLKNSKSYSLSVNLSSSLLKLNLSKNNIGKVGVIVLASGLKCCSKLHSLNLANNTIYQEANMNSLGNIDISSSLKLSIFSELRYCAVLQSLNVSCNESNCMEGVALGETLKHWEHLKVLNINQNYFNSSGSEMCEGLKSCTALHELDMGYNKFDDNVALIESLKYCMCLQQLVLDGTKFTLLEVTALVELLNYNESIEMVSLQHTSMNEACVRSLFKGISSCSNLKVLKICSCITDEILVLPSKDGKCIIDEIVDKHKRCQMARPSRNSVILTI